MDARPDLNRAIHVSPDDEARAFDVMTEGAQRGNWYAAGELANYAATTKLLEEIRTLSALLSSALGGDK